MYGKTRMILFLCTAVICAVLVLTGCKPSPAFVETVYDDRAEEEDESADVSSIDNSEDNSEEDTELPPQTLEDDTGDPRDREREDPTAGEEERDDTAPEPEHNEDANPDDAPGTPSSSSEPAKEADQTPSEEETTPADGESSGQSGEAAGTEKPDGPEIRPELVRQVVDAAGRTVELPESVEHVTAVGEAAVIVEMLGGSERLSATSSSIASGLAGELINSESEMLWSGDGSWPLSDEQFSRLLELNPQACFEISGQTTFTGDQLEEMETAGIAYVVLPSLNTDEGICLAVKLIGQVLGSDGESDARERAEEYLEFHDRAISLVASRADPYRPDGIDYAGGYGVSAGDGVTALYVSGWDGAAEYSLHDDAYETLSGTGLAYTATGYLSSPVTYYLSLAGVANAAALQENNYTIEQSKLKYINPIHSPNKTLSVEGGWELTYDPSYVFTSAGGICLGESGFPAVIAASEEIKYGIESCPLWVDYGMTSSATGLTSGYGFLDMNGDIVISTVHGPYEVLVLPSGVGSWAAGSGESVLTSLWAACRIRGVVSESELRAYTAEFYERFYGTVLSEGQLDRILHEGS